MSLAPPFLAARTSTVQSRHPWWTFVAASVVMTITLALSYGFFQPFGHGIDDADITMTYARNIAQGHGYVYEAGGERVEGSTSPLWTLLCAGLYYVGLSGMNAVFATGILLTALSVFASMKLSRYASTPELSNVSAIVTAICLALSPSFLAWSGATLMDTAVWTVCATLGVAAALNVRSRAGTWVLVLAEVLIVVARPEALVVAPLLLACASLVCIARGETLVAAVRRLALPALIVLAAFLVLVTIRLTYFGSPLPNTYYAKVGGNQFQTSLVGLRYVIRTLAKQPLLLLALCAAMVTFMGEARRILANARSRRPSNNGPVARVVLAVVLVVGTLLPILEGADHFPAGRMLQPFVPVACALLASSFTRIFQSNPLFAKFGILPALALLGALGWVRFVKVESPRLMNEFAIASEGRGIAQILVDKLGSAEHYPSLGVTAAGGIAYAYPGHVYDLLGLNWVAMAHASRVRSGIPGHSAFVAEVFWRHPPDLVGLDIQVSQPNDACGVYSRDVAWTDLFLRGQLSTDAFRDRFLGLVIPVHDRYLTAFATREWAKGEMPVGVTLLPWPADSAKRPGCSLSTTDLDHK